MATESANERFFSSATTVDFRRARFYIFHLHVTWLRTREIATSRLSLQGFSIMRITIIVISVIYRSQTQYKYYANETEHNSF